MAKKKAGQKQLKRKIKEAARNIPKLIADEHRLAQVETAIPHHLLHRRKLLSLWTAVAIMSGLIFALWYWNMRATFASLWQGPQSEEVTLVSHAASEVREAIQPAMASRETVNSTSSLEARERVKSLLQEVLSTSTTAVSNTLALSTTST